MFAKEVGAMNRPGVLPQNLRGMPQGGYVGQQNQQPGRGAPNRLPNGKIAGNASGWSFGPGVPMNNVGGVPGQGRQIGGGNVSFAQSVAGSQPSTPLDLSLSDFPSLSNTQQLPTPSSQTTMWGTAGSRSLAGSSLQRPQGTPLSQPQQPEDMFSSSSSRLPSSAQSPFRFGSQASIGQPSQIGQPPTADDFPPLNRNANGDIGQERAASSLLSAIGPFGATQPGASGPSLRTGNGLLNALSASNRAPEARSPSAVAPPGSQRPQPRDTKSPLDSNLRQKPAMPPLKDDASQPAQTSSIEGSLQPPENRNPLGAIGNDAPSGVARDEAETRAPEGQDPLSGMTTTDKFGIKGLRTLMNSYPDYQALVCGIDPQGLGLDWNSTEQFSRQIFSIFDESAPRPAVPKFGLPECYNVTNVQPIENKISSFNEEILMWIFYSSPGDIKQHWSAQELNSRNWRWHKKLQVWLTKDDVMIPHVLSPNHERGYYIVWDTENWRKERRELTLYYADLETNTTSS